MKGCLKVKSIKVKPLKNEIVDKFIADNDLFATINSIPANIIFLDNFISNINLYKDIFMHNNMHENIFFSLKFLIKKPSKIKNYHFIIWSN